MAKRNGSGRLNAEEILRRPSEQEALNLDEQSLLTLPNPARIVSSEADSKHHHQLYLWWKRHVITSVPHETCRDHFANERTALGYIRTAQAFAILGVVIAQLMRLQRSENPDPHLGFFVVSMPLSCVCHIMALLITFGGCYRFFEWQKNMARGQAISSGWVILSVFTLTFLVLLCTFALITTISIRRDT